MCVCVSVCVQLGVGDEPKRYYSTLPGPLRAREREAASSGRRKEEGSQGGVRHSLYQSPHLLLLQGYNRQVRDGGSTCVMTSNIPVFLTALLFLYLYQNNHRGTTRHYKIEGEVVLLLHPQHNLVSMVTLANLTSGFDRNFAGDSSVARGP